MCYHERRKWKLVSEILQEIVGSVDFENDKSKSNVDPIYKSPPVRVEHYKVYAYGSECVFLQTSRTAPCLAANTAVTPVAENNQSSGVMGNI
jgi:hypothetical protein